jgi:hypothetical protein
MSAYPMWKFCIHAAELNYTYLIVVPSSLMEIKTFAADRSKIHHEPFGWVMF